MTINRGSRNIRWVNRLRVGAGFVSCLGVLFVYEARGQGTMPTPLDIHSPESIYNEFGAIIKGDSTTPEGENPLVHILYVGGGIQPSATNGAPLNTIVEGGETYIGNLIAPSILGQGLFAASIDDPRPPEGSELFVRVYNDATYSNSLFYADSTNIMVVAGNTVLEAYLGPMTNIIDSTRDTDVDEIPDYWEHLKTGGNPTGLVASVDDDGDGATALDEYVAGTDPFDEASTFLITAIDPLYSETNYVEHVWTNPETEVTHTQRVYAVEGEILSWPSVGGRAYRVVYTTNLVVGPYAQLPGATNLPATPPVNVYTNKIIPDVEVPVYYGARVWMVE